LFYYGINYQSSFNYGINYQGSVYYGINYSGSCCGTSFIIITFDFVIHETSTVIIIYYRGSVYFGKCH
jgi:hypothetical protein